MAFGITREELYLWKAAVQRGEMAYLTHYWFDSRFPEITTVTKVGNANLDELTKWCERNALNPTYIHHRTLYPHFDLLGAKQLEILLRENLVHHITRFNIK